MGSIGSIVLLVAYLFVADSYSGSLKRHSWAHNARVGFGSTSSGSIWIHRLDMTADESKLGSVFDSFIHLVKKMTNPSSSSSSSASSSIYDEDIATAKVVMMKAVAKEADPTEVVEQLSNLEKLMRKKNRMDEGQTSRQTLQSLNGAWRLVFTTGTVDTQKKIKGKINYFPIKAVQCFNTETMALSNGIYIGDLAVLKFFGSFQWNEKARKLEFDFDALKLLGLLTIPLKSGEAAKIGSSTGLGSEGNVELAKREKKPFFNWISADTDIATARGGGGGLALWRRDVDMQATEDVFVV
jgi:hypothetical protein